jgi:hypothetical protein
MKKLLACAVAVLCVASVASISFAGGYEAPVQAVECAKVECGHDDGACGGQGCCHVHSKDSSHGVPMDQLCGVCGQYHGNRLFDHACFMHNLGCAWKQLNNAGQTAVCCTLGVFKDAMNLWGMLGSGESASASTSESTYVASSAAVETK